MSNLLRGFVLSALLASAALLLPSPAAAQFGGQGSGVKLNGKLGAWGAAIPTGFWITGVQPYSPAVYAGLRAGDVIVRVNDRLIHSEAALNQALHAAGRRARLLVRNQATGELRYTWINLWR
jgi:S1-C subfamily serine protease